MIVGVPRELKSDEYRIGMIPAGVHLLSTAGHEVLIEKGAGLGSGIADEEFEQAGAQLVSAADVWKRGELIVKVKEPQPPEWPQMHKGQLVLTYFHFASDRKLIEAGISARNHRHRLRNHPRHLSWSRQPPPPLPHPHV